MITLRVARLLMTFALAEVALALAYLVEWVRGNGGLLVMAVLALCALSLVVLATTFWRRELRELPPG